MLTREEILSRGKPRTRTVESEELGGSVILRAITANERDTLEMFVRKQHGNIRGVRAKMLRLCCCDADGKPLFEEKDEPALGELDGGSMERIVEQCMEMCGLKSQEIDGGKA